MKDTARWKNYAKGLLFYIEQIEERSEDVKAMKTLFERYTSGKIFRGDGLFIPTGSKGSIYYNADGVEINYSSDGAYQSYVIVHSCVVFRSRK